MTDHRQEADKAFTNAIHQGRLSASSAHPLYAGAYMYMGKDAAGRDTFKHINTRAYLPHPG